MGYTYVRTVTIDHTKVPNTDQSNYPVLFSGTYTYLKTTENGGNVTNSSGYDIIFTSDAAGATKLDHEIETYTATTGAVNFWVRVPTVSHTADTVIYLWYGNAAIITSQENKTGVWNSNFKGVWHLPNGTSLSVADSTGLNSATNSGATAATGRVDGAAAFDGSSSHYIDGGNATAISTNQLTVETWVNPAVTSRGDLVARWYNGSTKSQFDLLYGLTAGKPQFYITSGALYNSGVGSTVMSTGTWYHVVGTYDGTTVAVYLNGVLQSSTSPSVTLNTASLDNYRLGGNTSGDGPLSGSLDEVRISNTARSADWITTEYNNQNSPSTFYTVGAEAVVGTRLSIFFQQAVQRAAVR